MIGQEPEEINDRTELGSALTEAAALRRDLAEEQEKAKSYLANWQRVQADFINYKRWAEQDKEEFCRFANSALIISLLPVLDDLERAVTSIPTDLIEAGWVEGIKLIERKFRTSLEKQGLCAIKAVGEPFDPYQHEAVRRDRGREGTIIQEVQKGYKLNDKVIRPSRVVVGSGETE